MDLREEIIIELIVADEEICKYLDLEQTRTYAGKGCQMTTVDVYPLLEAQRDADMEHWS